MEMKARIEGFFLTQSPIHQTQPGVQGYVDAKEGRAGLQLSYTKTRLGQCQVQMSTTMFGENRLRTEVPMVQGASLRGVLRRAATKRLLRAINQPIRPDLFQVLSAGAFHRKDMGGEKTADMLNAANKNAFVGLFGGGGASLPSNYSASDLLPITAATEFLIQPWVRDAAGVIKRGTTRDDSGREFDQTLTHIYATIRRDPFMSGEGVEFIHDHDVQYTQRRKDIESTKKADGGSPLDLSMMSYVQAIVPGVPLNLSLTFKEIAGPQHIGLLLLALEDIVNTQALGGASRRGFGRFSPTLKLFAEGLDAPITVFETVIENGSKSGYKLSAELQGYVDAATDSINSTSIALLEDLLITTKSKALDKPDDKEAA